MRMPRLFQISLSGVLCAVALVLFGCTSERKREPVIAEVFGGPAEFHLRQEIRPGSKQMAAVRHGEKLQVVQMRRRFIRVRTENGQEGWTDLRQVLTSKQMEELRDLSARAAKLPSQGSATVFGALNIHSEPSRQAPSFYRLAEGVKVEVLAHRLSERSTAAQSIPRIEVRKPAAPVKKKRKEPEVPPPPRPAPPTLPANWLELSKTVFPEPPPEPEPEPVKGKKPRKKPAPKRAPMDDWSLVRTPNGKAGWALTRMLVMAIPDDVAQYSEGARITSYFSLGKVQDGDAEKHHWLWTTIRDGLEPYEFDSFRVFIYTARRHRYETAYIERDVKGYYPIETRPGDKPSFTLLIEEEDGSVFKKTYAFEGYLVRLIAKTPAKLPPRPELIEPEDDPAEQEFAANQPPESPSFTERIKAFKDRILR